LEFYGYGRDIYGSAHAQRRRREASTVLFFSFYGDSLSRRRKSLDSPRNDRISSLLRVVSINRPSNPRHLHARDARDRSGFDRRISLNASRIAELRDCPNRLELFEITRKAAIVVRSRDSNLLDLRSSVSPRFAIISS